MHQNKSSSYDGLPFEFYIVFFFRILLINWLHLINFSFEYGLLASSQRNGVITLLPPKIVTLCLLATHYKLIAKTMAHRLKLALDGLNHKEQNGFMKGRNIGCNIHNVLDMIEYAYRYYIPGSMSC